MIKKILIIVGVIVSVLVLTAGGFMGWFKYQLRVLKHLETAQINDSVYVLKGDMSNMYLLKINDTFIAFDAADNVDKLKEACNELAIDPLLVKAVFLTHSDGDHVNGLLAFPNADVYLAKKEELLLKEKGYRHFLGQSMINKLPVKNYKILEDGDSVVIDDIVIHAIATPGHTIGSMCYRYTDAIFTGDLCYIYKGDVKPMLDIFTEDRKQDSLSILKVSRIDDISKIYTAHSGYSTDLKEIFKAWN